MKGFNVDIYYVPALGATGGRPDLLQENSGNLFYKRE